MTSQSDEVHIAHRFRGPPASGNGGYVVGLVAEWIDGPAEVTLLAPPPLDVPLHRRRDDAEVMLFDAITNYARGRPFDEPFDFDIPGPPSEDELEAAAMSFPGPSGHPIPGCFVCGTERGPGDGLCIYPGESPHRDVAVAEWIPDEEYADVHGHVDQRFIWAALDCPSDLACATAAAGAAWRGWPGRSSGRWRPATASASLPGTEPRGRKHHSRQSSTTMPESWSPSPRRCGSRSTRFRLRSHPLTAMASRTLPSAMAIGCFSPINAKLPLSS